MADQMRLRWTSHQGTLLSVLDALLSSESLVDVTLGCEGQYLRAHKVILSACSPYFQELLNVDTNKHPIFFLNNVTFAELKALINYMYRGEVVIAKEDLTSLLQVAQALKIRGLADVEMSFNRNYSDMLILPDLGNKQSAPPRPVTPLPPQSVPIPAASTSSNNVCFQQPLYHAHQIVDSSAVPPPSPIISPPSAAAQPPPLKKRRSCSGRFAQAAQVKNQSQVQLGDPRIVVQRLSIAQMDPFENGPGSSSHHYEETEIENIETTRGVKPEDTDYRDLDLTEDYNNEENSMSQSGFSESWLSDEGDTSGMGETGGEVPSGSGGTNEGSVGVGGAGLVAAKGQVKPKPLIFQHERFYLNVSQCGDRTTGVCVTCGKTVKDLIGTSSNFIAHLKGLNHLKAYTLYRQLKPQRRRK